ncbi:MAG: hypothetical protein R3C25_07550 [Hyphomonadaceae bacterium]
MRKLSVGVAALALALIGAQAPAFGQAASTASIVGNYARPNGDPVEVYDCDGKLCGHITGGERNGFEMLHGMESTGPNEWRGNQMKHPAMPGFMTFNGTVTVVENGLSVRGCAIGQSFCDAEVWTRQ